MVTCVDCLVTMNLWSVDYFDTDLDSCNDCSHICTLTDADSNVVAYMACRLRDEDDIEKSAWRNTAILVWWLHILGLSYSKRTIGQRMVCLFHRLCLLTCAALWNALSVSVLFNTETMTMRSKEQNTLLVSALSSCVTAQRLRIQLYKFIRHLGQKTDRQCQK